MNVINQSASVVYSVLASDIAICNHCKSAGRMLSDDLLCVHCELDLRFRLVVNGKWAGRYRSVGDASKKAMVIAGQVSCRSINIYPTAIDFVQYLEEFNTITSTQLMSYGMSKAAAANAIKKAVDDGIIRPCGHADIVAYRRKNGRLVPSIVKDKVIKYTRII